jgi:hypothetical protein
MARSLESFTVPNVTAKAYTLKVKGSAGDTGTVPLTVTP